MSRADSVLGALSDETLLGLGKAIGAGWLTGNSPDSAFASHVAEHAESVAVWLRDLEKASFTNEQIGRLVSAVRSGRQRDKVLLPDLVMSGPDVPGVPTADTHVVVQTLFQQAEAEVVVAGYAFFNGRNLFEPLAKKMSANPRLKVLFHVDVSRRPGDSSTADSIVVRFADEFRNWHWPWTPSPEIYFDPRALEADPKARACLHAKVVIIDRRLLFVGSANFTEAAQQKNIEIGVQCSAPYLAERVASYFEGLRKGGQLRRLP